MHGSPADTLPLNEDRVTTVVSAPAPPSGVVRTSTVRHSVGCAKCGPQLHLPGTPSCFSPQDGQGREVDVGSWGVVQTGSRLGSLAPSFSVLPDQRRASVCDLRPIRCSCPCTRSLPSLTCTVAPL